MKEREAGLSTEKRESESEDGREKPWERTEETERVKSEKNISMKWEKRRGIEWEVKSEENRGEWVGEWPSEEKYQAGICSGRAGRVDTRSKSWNPLPAWNPKEKKKKKNGIHIRP